MVNNVSDVTHLSSGMLKQISVYHVLKHSIMTRYLVTVYVLEILLLYKMEYVDLVTNKINIGIQNQIDV